MNPFLKTRSRFILYSLLWILIAGIHFTLLAFNYEISWKVALADSLVFNILYAFIALSLWFVIKFSRNNNRKRLQQFVNHLATLVITLLIWIILGYYLLKILIPDSLNYQSFLDETLTWRFFIGFFYYLILILLYYLQISYDDLKEKMEGETELRTLLKETELNRLKSQINPHFLFNSLNSVSSLTISKPEKAREMVVKLSDYLRYSLVTNEQEKTKLLNELQHTKLYLEIEKVRFAEKLEFENIVPDECLNMELPTMILQPLYENAIKHGVYESTETVRITTHCSSNEEQLIISIKNNFDPEAAQRKGKGIGLQNVAKRLELLYQESDLIKVIKKETCFEVILYFPQLKP